MGLITPNDYDDLRSLYEGQLRYLLSAEKLGAKGLEAMIKHAQDEQVKQAFQSHMQETEVQAERIGQLVSELHGDADDLKDPVTVALIGSGENIARESSEGPVRDAGLIGTAQKIEHYEIASYGIARDWAQMLGLQHHVDALQTTLDEEKHADALLNSIAQRANATAAQVAAD